MSDEIDRRWGKLFPGEEPWQVAEREAELKAEVERLRKPLEISLDGSKLIRWVTPTEYERVMYVDELLEQIAERADQSRLKALLERLVKR